MAEMDDISTSYTVNPVIATCKWIVERPDDKLRQKRRETVFPFMELLTDEIEL